MALVEYSSSESSDGDCSSPSSKRALSEEANLNLPEAKKNKSNAFSDEQMKLPLPQSITELFSDTADSENSGYQGRIRSFPHVRGNWATFVFIKYNPSEEFKDCCRLFKEQITVSLSSCDSSIDWPTFHLFASSELHISLSRTVPIQYHLIEPLIADIRVQLLKKFRFILTLKHLSFYSNEEQTRSFIGLNVHEGETKVTNLVDSIDEVFKKFGLPIFYEDRSFHISLVWCLGNVLKQLTPEMKQSLEELWLKLLHETDVCMNFPVSTIYAKSGKKQFNFNLLECSNR